MLALTWPQLSPASVVVDDRVAVCEALCAGAGLGVLPAFLGEPHRDNGELHRLGAEPLSAISVRAVFLPEQRKDVRIRTLIRLMKSALRAWSPADPPPGRR